MSSRRLLGTTGLFVTLALLAGCDAKTRDFFAPTIGSEGPRAAGISGVVEVDSVGRAGIRVTVTPTNRTANTSSSGRYSFAPLPPATYTVSLSNIPPGIVCPITRQDVVVPSGTLVIANFSCFTAGSVTGTADVDGMPLADMPIVISGQGGGGTVNDTTTTGSSGGYDFPDLPPGDYTITAAPPPGVACTPAVLMVTVVAGVVSPADFMCTALGTISGTVILDGSPIQGVTITLSGDSHATTVTDASGAFTFSGIQPGDVILQATGLPANVSCSPFLQRVTVAAGSSDNVVFACVTQNAPNPGSVPGDYDVIYTPVQSSCGLTALPQETITVTTSGSNLMVGTPRLSVPVVGPYLASTGRFLGTTGWQPLGANTEFNELWDVTLVVQGGQIVISGTITIQVRELGSAAHCQDVYQFSGVEQ